MKYIKTFESHNQSLLEFVNTSQKSEFLPNLTIEEIAKKYNQTPEYILEFEEYLKMCQENGSDIFTGRHMSSPDEEYQFHLKENYPEYRGDDENISHGHDL